MKVQLNVIFEIPMTNAIKTAVYGDANANAPFINSLVSRFISAYRDEELIWDVQHSNDAINIVNSYLLRRFAKYAQYSSYLDPQTGTFKLSENGRKIDRSADGTTNGAVENQPINADIEEITSPNGKTKTVATSSESVTENKLSDDIDKIDMMVNSNIWVKMWEELLPMLDYYCKIY